MVAVGLEFSLEAALVVPVVPVEPALEVPVPAVQVLAPQLVVPVTVELVVPAIQGVLVPVLVTVEELVPVTVELLVLVIVELLVPVMVELLVLVTVEVLVPVMVEPLVLVTVEGLVRVILEGLAPGSEQVLPRAAVPRARAPVTVLAPASAAVAVEPAVPPLLGLLDLATGRVEGAQISQLFSCSSSTR